MPDKKEELCRQENRTSILQAVPIAREPEVLLSK